MPPPLLLYCPRAACLRRASAADTISPGPRRPPPQGWPLQRAAPASDEQRHGPRAGRPRTRIARWGSFRCARPFSKLSSSPWAALVFMLKKRRPRLDKVLMSSNKNGALASKRSALCITIPPVNGCHFQRPGTSERRLALKNSRGGARFKPLHAPSAHSPCMARIHLCAEANARGPWPVLCPPTRFACARPNKTPIRPPPGPQARESAAGAPGGPKRRRVHLAWNSGSRACGPPQHKSN